MADAIEANVGVPRCVVLTMTHNGGDSTKSIPAVARTPAQRGSSGPGRARRLIRRFIRPRLGMAVAVLAGLAGLLGGYHAMARSVATNADGSANVLQAWDMVHGNVLLSGWTLSDVSFYTTELLQYALLTAA